MPVLPSSQWRAFLEPHPPPLEPWQLGAVPPLPDMLEAALAERATGSSDQAVMDRLREDLGDKLANALAGLLDGITGLPARHRNRNQG